MNDTAQRAVGPVAVAAIAAAVGFAALGAYGEAGSKDTKAFLIVLAVVAIGAAAVFGYIVPRGLGREAAGVTALALSAAGLLTVIVFWSGLPPILGAAGLLLGYAGWNASSGRRLHRGAAILGALALVADVAVVLGDWLANR
ncbi:MAG TPA: hypothetical protein VFA56_02630 [Gaiellaceae bacterium]|nr:hypothetical protein [Gaiellaceae bacterium]